MTLTSAEAESGVFDSPGEAIHDHRINPLRLVLNLVVAGASAHDLVEILSSDGVKSETLTPLVVVLRQYTGETVRAPDEVLQVAEDIRERIKAITAGL